MAGSDFAQLFNDASAQYSEITGKKFQDFPKLDTAEDLINCVTKQNEDFKHFREKAGILTTTLSFAVKPIELVGNMAAGAASAVFPPSSMVFGAAMYLISAAKGVSASLDAIVGMLDVLKDFTVRLKVYNKVDLSVELREKLTQILVTVIEIFARSTKKIKGGFATRLKMVTRNVLLGSDKEMQNLLAKLQKLTHTEGQLVSAETLVESKKTGKGVEDIQSSVNEQSTRMQKMGITQDKVASGVDQLLNAMEESQVQTKEEKDQKHQEAIRLALKPSAAPQDRFDQIRRERVPDSGDWIFAEEALSQWIQQSDEPVLWVQGNPGAGKSFLTYSIITHLHELSKEDDSAVSSGSSIAYFFFRDNNADTRSFHQALRDLAYQLTQSDPTYAKYVSTVLRDNGNISTIRLAWQKLFLNYWLTDVDDHAYLVLDGLDESSDEDRAIFFELLEDLRDAGEDCRLSVAMVGRPHIFDEITDALGKFLTIFVDATKNGIDITNYIQASIRKSKILNRVSKKLKEKVVQTLLEKADGMFMWAKLMIADISKKSRESAIEKALDDAPRGLSEMLTKYLEGFSSRLSDDDASDLNDLLAWICLAPQPLTLGELDAMLRLKSEEGEPVLFLEGKLRQQFAAFFTLTRADGLTTSELVARKNISTVDDDEDVAEEATTEPEEDEGEEDVDNQTDFDSHPDTTVAFSHSSISDFFRNPSHGKVKADGEDHPPVGVDLQKAYLQLVVTCTDIIVDESLEKRMKAATSLLTHAKKNWIELLEHVDITGTEDDLKTHLALNIFRMLTEPPLILKFGGVRNWLFYKKENSDLLYKWLTEEVVKGQLPSSTLLESIDDNVNASLELFKPMMQQIAIRWLRPSGSNPYSASASPVIIWSWLQRKEGQTLSAKVPQLTTEQVLVAARWAQLEENSEWHQRLGMTFRERYLDDDAVKFFDKALELDSRAWNARSGIAILRMRQERRQEAIDLDELTLKEAEQCGYESTPGWWKEWGQHSAHARLAENFASLAREIDDDGISRESFELDTKAFEHCQKCVELKSDDFGSIIESIEYLYGVARLSLPWGPTPENTDQKHSESTNVPSSQDCFERVMSMLHKMHETQRENGLTNFTACLLSKKQENAKYWDQDYFIRIQLSAVFAGEVDWLKARYREAIVVARKQRETVTEACLRLCLAALYYDSRKDAEDLERALRLAESVALEAAVSTKVETEIQYIRSSALNFVGEICINLALDDPSKAERCVKKMERIVARSNRRNPMLGHDTVPTSDIGFYLAPWYVKHGRTEEARDVVRPIVKESIALLSDDTPDNDYEGYTRLAGALLVVGDYTNAIAVYQIIRPRFDGYMELTEDTESDQATEKLEDEQKEEEKTKKEESAATEDTGEGVVQETQGQEEDRSKDSKQEQEEDKSKDTKDEQEDESEDDSDGEGINLYTLQCDGPCHRAMFNYDDCTCCILEIHVFCSDCFKLLQEDRFPLRLCSQKHEFMKIPKLETKLKDSEILVDSKIMAFDEFKKVLKRQWGL